MTRLESGYTSPLEVVKENSPSPDAQKNPPHGVDLKTYSFLLTAIDYNKNVKNIFDNIDKTTMALMLVYYNSEYSIRDLAKQDLNDLHILASRIYWELTSTSLTPANVIFETHKKQRLGRTAIKRHIVDGLNTLWENLPVEIQEAYLKEEVIKIKEAPKSSPTAVKKKSEAAKTLWQDSNYRKTVLQSMQTRGKNPAFIQKLKDTRNRDPRPQETIEKIRKAAKNIWVVRRFLRDNLYIDTKQKTEEGQRLYKDNILIAGPTVNQTISFLGELQQNPSNIVRGRISERDIKRIALELIAGVQNVFSTSSPDELKRRTAELDKKLEDVKKQLQTRRPPYGIEIQIGKDEMSMWQQIRENNLEALILQTRLITPRDLTTIADYYEKGIIREDFKESTINRLTEAVVKLVVAKVIP